MANPSLSLSLYTYSIKKRIVNLKLSKLKVERQNPPEKNKIFPQFSIGKREFINQEINENVEKFI